MKIELDKRFKKKAAGRYGRYDFEIGILQDKYHKEPDYKLVQGKDKLGRKRKLRKYKYTQYAGDKIRKPGSKRTNTRLSDISEKFRIKEKYLTKPFKKRSNDLIKFTKVFFDVVKGKTQKKRLINLLQAIIRNPILRRDYGNNSLQTALSKGFDRYMIDTAQFFKNIKARVKVRRVQR